MATTFRLEFQHDCRNLGCRSKECVLCKYCQRKRCIKLSGFNDKYLANLDAIMARCGASIHVVLVDASTGQPAEGDAAAALVLQLCILDGGRYEKLDSNERLIPSALGGCELLLNKKGQPLLLPSRTASTDERKRVLVTMQSTGRVPLPDIKVTDSSEALLGGKQPNFYLCVRALQREYGAQPDKLVPAPHVMPLISEGFVVATQRTKPYIKVEIPHVDDSISKVNGIGDQTKKKLDDLRAAAASAGIPDLNVPFNEVTNVGQLRDLVEMAERNKPLRENLKAMLRLTKGWDTMKEHVMMSVDTDTRLRVWYADEGGDLGLVFGCAQYNVVDMSNPLGVLRRQSDPDSGTVTISWDLTAAAENEAQERLQVAAIDAWREDTHPGWFLLPYEVRAPDQGSQGAGAAQETSTTTYQIPRPADCPQMGSLPRPHRVQPSPYTIGTGTVLPGDRLLMGQHATGGHMHPHHHHQGGGGGGGGMYGGGPQQGPYPGQRLVTSGQLAALAQGIHEAAQQAQHAQQGQQTQEAPFHMQTASGSYIVQQQQVYYNGVRQQQQQQLSGGYALPTQYGAFDPSSNGYGGAVGGESASHEHSSGYVPLSDQFLHALSQQQQTPGRDSGGVQHADWPLHMQQQFQQLQAAAQLQAVQQAVQQQQAAQQQQQQQAATQHYYGNSFGSSPGMVTTTSSDDQPWQQQPHPHSNNTTPDPSLASPFESDDAQSSMRRMMALHRAEAVARAAAATGAMPPPPPRAPNAPADQPQQQHGGVHGVPTDSLTRWRASSQGGGEGQGHAVSAAAAAANGINFTASDLASAQDSTLLHDLMQVLHAEQLSDLPDQVSMMSHDSHSWLKCVLDSLPPGEMGQANGSGLEDMKSIQDALPDVINDLSGGGGGANGNANAGGP